MHISFSNLYAKKIVLKDFLSNKLSIESIRKSMNDSHAKRFPRPCGLTIHPAVGCNLNCIYCYVPDMFSTNYIASYGLNGEELVLALLSNKYFLPTIYGTYLAFGSITEPFHPVAASRTFEYLYFINKYLENPIQFSTKFFLTDSQIDLLKKYKNLSISPLITIISINYASLLEPNAPRPEKRLETIKKLHENGFKPFLFYRPLIPGKILGEAEEVLREAKKAGAIGVVIGGFRITIRILKNLRKHDLLDKNIIKNFSKKIEGQIPLQLKKYKEELVQLARELGLIPFKSTCCANNYSIMLNKGLRIPCINLCFLKKFCTDCPVKCSEITVDLDEEDVRKACREILNKDPVKIEDREKTLNIFFEKRLSYKRRKEIAIIEGIFRKKIEVKYL